MIYMIYIIYCLTAAVKLSEDSFQSNVSYNQSIYCLGIIIMIGFID